MKKILTILTIACFCSFSHLSAQAQGGRPPRGGQGGERGERPLRERSSDKQDNFIIQNVPEIPDLTLDQRVKLTDILSKEHKDTLSLKHDRRKIEMEINDNPDLSTKDLRKRQDKTNEIDAKISKTVFDNDKKVQKLLSVDQYQFFNQKKRDIAFKRLPRQRTDVESRGQRPPRERNENQDFQSLDEF